MSAEEKLRAILRLLSLSRKSLCLVLGTTRDALGGWLDNSSEPGEADLGKIGALFSLVEASGISAPLFRGRVEEPMDGFGSSILGCLLRGEYLDEKSSLPEMLRAADRLSRERERRIAERRVNVSNLSEAEKDLILEDNLNCL